MGNVSSGSRDEDSKSSVSIHYPSNNNTSNNSNNTSPSNVSNGSGGGRKFSRGRLNFLTGTNQVAITTLTNSNQVAETPRSDQTQLNTSRSNSPLMIGTSSSSHHQPTNSNGSSSTGTFVHHQYSSSGGSFPHHHTIENMVIPIQLQSVESLQLITELYYSVYLPHDWKVQLLQYGSSNNNISNYSQQQSNVNNNNNNSTTANNTNNNNNNNIIYNNNNNISATSPPSSSSNSLSNSPSQISTASNQPSTTAPNNSATNNIQQKIFFSSFDRNFEKDFLEIYVTFSPHSIEKEAQLAIEDIQELSRNDLSSGGNLHRTPSSSMMRQVSGVTASSVSSPSPSSPSSGNHSTMLEPKLVKGITHVVDKHIQPEKKALYFIIQFRHELLPQKLLYKKIYFIQDTNGLLYCLMLTTTRKEAENILGYSLNLNVPSKSLLIPSINIQQELFNGNGTPPTSSNHDEVSKLTVSPPSSNRNSGNLSHSSSNASVLVDSVDKTADCTSPSNDIISKRKNSNTIAQNNSKKMKKRLSAAFNSIGGSMFEDEDASEIFTSNLVFNNSGIPPIDGASWIDILVKEFFTVKSIADLKRKTSNLDGDGIVLSVPMCFIPSLRIESDACSGEDEMVRHFGVGDFGKRSQDYKLILYHPIQYLANKNSNQPRSRETLENIFVTYVNFGNTHKNKIEDYSANFKVSSGGNLLEQFYTTTFKEQVLKTCTIISEKDKDIRVSLYSQQSNSEVSQTEGDVPTLRGKLVELASTTYSGHTLKKVCHLIERNDRIWIFTYTSTSNLIAREIFEVMMSEVKYYKIV